MRIIIKTSQKNYHFNAKNETKVIDIKSAISRRTGINVDDQILMFSNQQLINNKNIRDYSIHENTILELHVRKEEKAQMASKKSPIIGKIENSDNSQQDLLPSEYLSHQFVRNTNVTGVYYQSTGNCYALAACSAYINTVFRIYGLEKNIPSFKDCYTIASYNENGGSPAESIRRLEEHFQFGIKCDSKDSIDIKDVMMKSVILSFGTSEEGYECVEKGEFLEYQTPNETQYGHATLIEGYDFEKDCYICKNSWEDKAERFFFTESAAHWVKFTRVYFDKESIKDKNYPVFESNVKKIDGNIQNKKKEFVLMDENTSIYSDKYIKLGKKPNNDGVFEYLGIDVDQYIKMELKRPQEQNPEYFNINQELKRRNPPIFYDQHARYNHNNDTFLPGVENVIIGGSIISVAFMICRAVMKRI